MDDFVNGVHLGALDRRGRVAQRVRDWFFSDRPSATLAWAMIAAVCIAILVWFFVWSPYGAPAAPIYAEF